jgi:hypothetical protein
MQKTLNWVAILLALLAVYLAASRPSTVAVGRIEAGAAVRVEPSGSSKWPNALLVQEGAVREDGAVLGLVQTSQMRAGIDLAAGRFTDSAFRLGNNQNLRFDAKGDSPPALIKNDANGFLNVVGGTSGVAIRSNDLTRTVVSIQNDGKVEIESGFLVLTAQDGRRYRVVVTDKGQLQLSPLS